MGERGRRARLPGICKPIRLRHDVPDVEMAYLNVPDEDDDEEEWEPHNLLGVAESEPSTAEYEPEPAHELPP